MNNHLPTSLDNLFVLNNDIHKHYTKQMNSPHLYVMHNSTYVKSFLNQAIKMWTSLPINIKNSRSIYIFKRNMKKYLLTL